MTVQFDDLLEALDKKNPGHQWVLKPDASLTQCRFRDLMVAMASDDKVVFLSPQADCCILTTDSHDDDDDDDDDGPNNLGYKLELIVVAAVTDGAVDDEASTIHLCATHVDAAQAPLNDLLACISNDDDANDATHCIDVTVKAFATTPRQALPTVTTMMTTTAIDTLRLHFVTVDLATAQHLTNTVRQLEFKQCTVGRNVDDDDDDDVDTDDASFGFGAALQQATRLETCWISCTQADLLSIGPALAAPASSTQPSSSLRHLHLTCHFWLTGPSWTALLQGLRDNTSLESLSILYLDIGGDAEWMALTRTLQQHPRLQHVHLGFTDNFADAHRRMTPERRHVRSMAVLEMVQKLTTLRSITWPVVQQDDHVAERIKALLESRQSI